MSLSYVGSEILNSNFTTLGGVSFGLQLYRFHKSSIWGANCDAYRSNMGSADFDICSVFHANRRFSLAPHKKLPASATIVGTKPPALEHGEMQRLS